MTLACVREVGSSRPRHGRLAPWPLANLGRARKHHVHDLRNDMGKGAAIWEPLGWRSGLFDRQGNVTDLMTVYD